MDCVKVLQLVGLSLNMLGVILLAFFATPAHGLRADGAESFGTVDNGAKKRIKKYRLYVAITIFSYLTIFLGFALQAYTLLL